MAKRSYQQNCSLAISMDCLGERWTLLIVRELLIKPRRFRDLLPRLKGMGSNLLTSRLKEMEANGLIEKVPLVSSEYHGYQLTHAGLELEPVVLALIRWGLRHSAIEQTKDKPLLSEPEWDVLAIKALFDPDAAQDVKGDINFALDDYHFYIGINSGVIITAPEPKPEHEVDVTIAVDKATAFALSEHSHHFDRAMAEGKLAVAGDMTLARRFFTLFSL